MKTAGISAQSVMLNNYADKNQKNNQKLNFGRINLTLNSQFLDFASEPKHVKKYEQVIDVIKSFVKKNETAPGEIPVSIKMGFEGLNISSEKILKTDVSCNPHAVGKALDEILELTLELPNLEKHYAEKGINIEFPKDMFNRIHNPLSTEQNNAKALKELKTKLNIISDYMKGKDYKFVISDLDYIEVYGPKSQVYSLLDIAATNSHKTAIIKGLKKIEAKQELISANTESLESTGIKLENVV